MEDKKDPSLNIVKTKPNSSTHYSQYK